jgi:hypothetical protein
MIEMVLTFDDAIRVRDKIVSEKKVSVKFPGVESEIPLSVEGVRSVRGLVYVGSTMQSPYSKRSTQHLPSCLRELQSPVGMQWRRLQELGGITTRFWSALPQIYDDRSVRMRATLLVEQAFQRLFHDELEFQVERAWSKLESAEISPDHKGYPEGSVGSVYFTFLPNGAEMIRQQVLHFSYYEFRDGSRMADDEAGYIGLKDENMFEFYD